MSDRHAETEARCGCRIGGLHRYGCGLVGHVDPPRGAAEIVPLHRIVVERDGDGVTSVRFVCDGGDDARCHHYPDCDCEAWTRELHGQRFGQRIGIERGHVLYADRDIAPAPGHENVQQRECWQDPWFNATTDSPLDFAELYDGREDFEAVYPLDWLVSGYVDTTFEGDYMTWQYLSSPPGQRGDA